MERPRSRCSNQRTSGCTWRKRTGGIAWLRALFQLRDQAVDSPRERLHVALGDILAERPDPLAVRRPQFVDERPAATRELHARGAEIVRVIAPLGQAELL